MKIQGKRVWIAGQFMAAQMEIEDGTIKRIDGYGTGPVSYTHLSTYIRWKYNGFLRCGRHPPFHGGSSINPPAQSPYPLNCGKSRVLFPWVLTDTPGKRQSVNIKTPETS